MILARLLCCFFSFKYILIVKYRLFVQIVRVIKGRGDVFDTSGRIASVKGAALNMTGQSSEGTVNLSAENEDLKVSAANSVGMC